MTYKLNPELSKISCPIILHGAGDDQEYPNGSALMEQSFPKNYIVENISMKSDAVIVTVSENQHMNPIAWVGEEALSFFYNV